MKANSLKPHKALNAAFLKVKPNRTEIDTFKSNLIQLLDHINDNESEEFHKNLVSDFLKKTYYYPAHFINTKGRNDLVIHNGENPDSTVGVIIEAKKLSNKAEMISIEKLNKKAFQELVLYYLRERITLKNIEVKHLVITNIYEWFIFDATTFDRLFAQNKELVKQFNDFESGRLADTRTDFFYKNIAEHFVESVKGEIQFAYFNIQDYNKALRNNDTADDKQLIALFKLLSPEHLLKLRFANDSNSLDKRFYSELLHIMGLTETKEGGKKLIGRNKDGEQHTGTIIEDAIIQLDSLDKLSRIDRLSQFGNSKLEQLFTIALELSITWINRVLFLKLLEAQLLSYHKGDKSYSFLSYDKIKSYDDLNSLFFQVLAKRHEERNHDVKKPFEQVPYLNSSLFEPTDLEQTALFISNLKDDKTIPITGTTVLKDEEGKKKTGKLTTLAYLFEFLNAYDFSSEGSEDIQEENKKLINASVLGLIFEKINGYKDGSFFTPGFITMYMCRETIRKAVVQKFNEVKNWTCKDIEDLYDKIDDRKEANRIVNSIKICDPAVGSGHFLVSALNEIISLKHDLKILSDRTGKRLKEYRFEVVNDELIVTDEEDGKLFEYNPKSGESQRIQETLFHEKQTIIENCLFGVDINPNSVKICRLRLWIELLKNAYYKNPAELETLPNIDINIKCGNSLISRFAIDADLSQALKKSKWTINSYRIAVDTYRNAESKEQKREMESLIASIKTDFRSEISLNDKKVKLLAKKRGDLAQLTQQSLMFELNRKEKSDWNKQVAKLSGEINVAEAEIEDIKANKIYENAFEWRFEFPEVLNDIGDFVGFDAIIGNPPYGASFNEKEKAYIKSAFKSYKYKFDSYVYFIEGGLNILKPNGVLEYITPILWLSLENCLPIRNMVLKEYNLKRIFIHGEDVFEEAVVNTLSFQVEKSKPQNKLTIENGNIKTIVDKSKFIDQQTLKVEFKMSDAEKNVVDKIRKKSSFLSIYGDVIQGITPYDSYKGQSKETIKNRVYHFNFKKDDSCGKWLDGKDLNRYSVVWNNQWLSYGNWLAAPREKKFFEGKRIIFREVPGKGRRIQAHIIEDEYYYGHSISPFKPFEEYNSDLEFILAIVNSKLISWYGNFVLPNFGKDVFPKLNPNDIKELPIPKVDNNIKLALKGLVNNIIDVKRQNVLASTIILENQVDEMLYQIFNLTEEEISIVEKT